MKESVETAAEANKRADDAERALAEVVLAAGGAIKVHDDVLRDPHRKVELEMRRCEYDLTIEFRAREITPQ